jgi:hypothetical protein
MFNSTIITKVRCAYRPIKVIGQPPLVSFGKRQSFAIIHHRNAFPVPSCSRKVISYETAAADETDVLQPLRRTPKFVQLHAYLVQNCKTIEAHSTSRIVSDQTHRNGYMEPSMSAFQFKSPVQTLQKSFFLDTQCLSCWRTRRETRKSTAKLRHMLGCRNIVAILGHQISGDSHFQSIYSTKMLRKVLHR